MKHIINFFINTFTNILAGIAGMLLLSFIIRAKVPASPTSIAGQIPIIPLPYTILGLYFVSIYFFWRFSIYVFRIYIGESAYNINYNLITKFNKIRDSQIIRGTRCSEWTKSKKRGKNSKSFRRRLSEMVDEGTHEIKRLWIIRNINDVKRLKSVVREYEGNSCISIKYYHLPGSPSYLPEFLMCGESICTFSIPAPQVDLMIGITILIKQKIFSKHIISFFDKIYEGAKFAIQDGKIKKPLINLLGEYNLYSE